jgi:hypothetical protein
LQAIADTARLVEDGIITGEQARTIEARAQEAMVYLGINAILCSGIIAATGGLIAWLGTPASVAVYGLALLGAGSLILVYGSELYRMFGNASALIGGGMLIGGASLELMKTYPDIAGTVMIASGFIVAAAAAWLLKAKRNSARFVTGAILLMGLAMHLVGIGFLLDQHGISGAAISAFYVYATALVVAAGWWVDVRLVTALAIVPFAQALDTGTFYFDAAYVFYSPEPTLSIIQMAILVAGCVWLAADRPERTARHARVLAVMAFIVANLSALVGSLFGDFIGETIWGPKYPHPWSEQAWREWDRARDAFRETALHLSSYVYSVLWAVALAALILWSAHKTQRGLFNASITFAGIHAYTQLFESFSDEPLAYVIAGFAAIPLAWGMWRLDHWIVARRGLSGST